MSKFAKHKMVNLLVWRFAMNCSALRVRRAVRVGIVLIATKVNVSSRRSVRQGVVYRIVVPIFGVVPNKDVVMGFVLIHASIVLVLKVNDAKPTA